MITQADPHHKQQRYNDMEEGRKRKRDVLSCRDCRRRKLKCDRELPTCGRCRRSGVGESCIYDAQATPTEKDLSSRNSPTFDDDVAKKRKVESSDLVSVVASQAETIRRLENRLAVLQETRDSAISRSRENEWNGVVHKQVQELSLFRGRAFKTKFFGTSHATCLIQDFSEARAFMAEIFPNSNPQRLRQEARKLDMQYKARGREVDMESANLATTEDFVNLLPTRTMADQLIKLYFESIENIYRILHKPSFMARYQMLWEDPSSADMGFVVVLLLAMSITRCMLPNQAPSFNPSGSNARSEAVSWMRACDGWIQKQSNKHRTLQIYQARVLRHLAMIPNLHKAKEVYSSAQALMSYFKSAGMHRDPRGLVASGGTCSAFDQEMRRRLWASVAEMELEAALDRGVASTCVGLYSDCDTPLNVEDDDLDEDISSLPPPKPKDQYTKCSYLIYSAQTRELRSSLTTIINNPRLSLSFAETLDYEQQIQKVLEGLPHWEEKSQSIARVLLDTQLRQFLIFLHSPSARARGYSRFMCYESAASIISAHWELCFTHGEVALSLLREDNVRAGLSLCYSAHLLTQSKTSLPPTLADLCNKSLQMFEDGIVRTGRGFHVLWYVSAWSGLCHASASTTAVAREREKEKVCERVLKSYYKCLAFQDVGAGGTTGTHSTKTNPSSKPQTLPPPYHAHAHAHTNPNLEQHQPPQPQGQNQNQNQNWLMMDNNDSLDMGDFGDEWFWPLSSSMPSSFDLP